MYDFFKLEKYSYLSIRMRKEKQSSKLETKLLYEMFNET